MPRTYEAIASQTVGSSVASVTFSDISGSFTDLVLVVRGGTSSGADNVWLRFNSDTGSNYSLTTLNGSGSAAASARASSITTGSISYNVGGATNLAQSFVVDIMSYANANVYKTYLSRVAQPDGSSTYPGVERLVGLWRSTSAITSITVGRTGGGNLLADSVISLFGVKAA